MASQLGGPVGGDGALTGTEGWRLYWAEGWAQPSWLMLVAPGQSCPASPHHTLQSAPAQCWVTVAAPYSNRVHTGRPAVRLPSWGHCKRPPMLCQVAQTSCRLTENLPETLGRGALSLQACRWQDQSWCHPWRRPPLPTAGCGARNQRGARSPAPAPAAARGEPGLRRVSGASRARHAGPQGPPVPPKPLLDPAQPSRGCRPCRPTARAVVGAVLCS